LAQLTPAVKNTIDKDFGAWLAWYIVTHNFIIPTQLDLRKTLFQAWDNGLVPKEEPVKEELVQASFVIKLVHLLYLRLAQAYIWKHVHMPEPSGEDDEWRMSKSIEASQMDSYKVGLAREAVHWLVHHYKQATHDTHLPPAFICLFFPGYSLEKVRSRAVVPLVELIN
jgi:hypothetical protein